MSPIETLEQVHVMIGCDDAYARHMTVMLLSLFANCTDCRVCVHVLVPPGFASRSRVKEALGEYATTLSYYTVPTAKIDGLKIREDVTTSVYNRLLLDDVLPPDIERVIYLDCDMLVRADIRDLWQIDLGDAVVAAASDTGWDRWDVLGLPPGAPYFNSGVMVIDTARWRQARISQQAMDFVSEYPDRLVNMHQCALNWVLQDKWTRLDQTWNAQWSVFGFHDRYGFTYFKRLPSVARNARIVHFNAPARPWLYIDDHPFKPDYLRYNAATPWHDEPPPDRYPHSIICKWLRKYAPVLLGPYWFIRRHII